MTNDIKTDSARIHRAKPAIWHPVIDFLLVGGASFVGGIVLIIWFTYNQDWAAQFNRYAADGQFIDISQHWLFWTLTVVISYPHLMASYRILYRSKAQVNKFRWSAIYVPCILLVLCTATLIALVVPADTTQPVAKQFAAVVNSNSGLASYMFAGLSVLNVVYLGWHYNLQGWRMTEVFGNMHGIGFSSREQRLIKSGFFAMVITHAVLLFPYSQAAFFKAWLPTLILGLPVVGGIALVLGGLGFYGAYQRTGKRIPINAITPWAVSFFWYYLVTRYHGVNGIVVVVLIAHALQYLSFSYRVERNLQLKQTPGTTRASVVKLVVLMLVLILCGYSVIVVPSYVIVANNWSLHLLLAFQLLVIAINLHHCFLDGAIWKSSNLEMRQTLFAHLGDR
ncbi:MAG: hypothetical protein NZ744_01800 [Pirellulaceae bacterium]|nr:hypothetical protein [Pirellulaceae bacterium]